jgi:hypothetical protein
VDSRPICSCHSLSAAGWRTVSQSRSPSGQAGRRQEIAGVLGSPARETRALLYGLDRLPAPGSRRLLVDDEAACHVLGHHGFDAISTQGAGGYVAARDDPELGTFSISVIAPAGEGLLKRLTRSRHRKCITIATLEPPP